MFENKKVMAKNILHYMDVNNVTATDVCKACGFKQNTFSDWVNAKTYPRIDKIELMARYFHVSKADLVEENREVHGIKEYTIHNPGAIEPSVLYTFPLPTDISNEDRKLLDQYHNVSPETRAAIDLLLKADQQKP